MRIRYLWHKGMPPPTPRTFSGTPEEILHHLNPTHALAARGMGRATPDDQWVRRRIFDINVCFGTHHIIDFSSPRAMAESYIRVLIEHGYMVEVDEPDATQRRAFA